MSTSEPLSFVYVMRAEIRRSARGWSHASTGPYKIGISKDPMRRLRDLSQVAGVTISLLHVIPVLDARVLEDALHDRFADKALTGEWFDLDDTDVAWLRQL